MKSRSGFVSNSSTSSYIIIIPEENFEEVLDGFETDAQKNAVRHLVGDSQDVCGVQCKVFDYVSGNYSSLEYEELPEELQDALEQEGENIYDIAYDYGNKVQNHSKGFYHCSDC